MGIQVSPDLFKWLQGHQLVREVKRNSANQLVLPQDISDRLFDGVLLSHLLKKLLLEKGEQSPVNRLDAIKQNSTPAIRLYNWNILTEALKPFGYVMDYAEKSKILALEGSAMVRLLQHLMQKGEQVIAPKLQVNVRTIGGKGLMDASNVFEILVISLCGHFKLSVQHALNLFLDSNKYLAHLLVKGLKGSFEPVLGFIGDIHSSLDFILDSLSCLDDQDNLHFLLAALKPCLISKDECVSVECVKTLQSLNDAVALRDSNNSLFKQWMDKQGANTVLFAVRRHPQLLKPAIALCYASLHWRFFQLLLPDEKSLLWNNEPEKVVFLRALLENSPSEMLREWTASECCSQWMKFMAATLKKSKPPQETVALLACLEVFWRFSPEVFEQIKTNLAAGCLTLLKTSFLSNSDLLHYQATRILFSLMSFFSTLKNPHAPVAYKILVSFLASEEETDRLTFLTLNFKEALFAIPTLPTTHIWQALAQSLQRSPSVCALHLLRTIVQMSKMPEEQQLDAIELLAQVACTHPAYGLLAVELFRLCVAQLPSPTEVIRQYGQVCLAQLYSLFLQMSRPLDNHSSIQYLKASNIIALLSCTLSQEEVKATFEPLVFHTYLRIQQQIKRPYLQRLLVPILNLYCSTEELVDYLEYYSAQPEEKSEEVESPELISMEAEVEQTKTLVTLSPAQSAIKDLSRLRQKIEDNRLRDAAILQKRSQVEEKQNKLRGKAEERRLIQFGSKSSNLEYECIKDWGSQKEELPQSVILYNLENEETNLADQVLGLIKRYRRLWRFVFFKFSQKAKEGAQEKMHIAEVWHMLRQYGMANLLKKEQSHQLVKKINEKLRRKHDLTHLTYIGFEEYLLQFSYLGFSRAGQSHTSPANRVLSFLNAMRSSMAFVGNTELFDHPDEAYLQDSEVLREYNRRLSLNPDFALPEGYKKQQVAEVSEQFLFSPISLACSKNITAYTTVLEVLDSIFQEKLQFRIIQACVRREERWIAKPAVFQNIQDRLKDYKGGYLLPKRTGQSAQLQLNKISPLKLEFHLLPRFSLGIKMGIAGLRVGLRLIGQEVAHWLDDALDAVEAGASKVGNKSKRKIDNEALRRRRASAHRLDAEHSSYQQKYKSRAETVKHDAQKARSLLQQEQGRKRDQQRLQKQQKQQEQEREMKAKLKEFEEAKKHMQAKRQEEKARLEQEEKARREAKVQYRKGVDEYFEKKKRELQQKASQLKANRQFQSKQSAEAIVQQAKKKHKAETDLLKREEITLEKIVDRKQRYETIWDDPLLQAQFLPHSVALKRLYQLLLGHQKARISATDREELSLSTLTYFSIRFAIVPFLINKQAITQIFRALLRVEPNMKPHLGLTQKTFNELLFRIAIKAKKVLNGQLQMEGESEIDSPNKSSTEPKKGDLLDEYMDDPSGVTPITMRKMLQYLKLPGDRVGVDERFKEVTEQKISKPVIKYERS